MANVKKTKRNEHHVVKNKNGGWDVKVNGAKRRTAHASTKEKAIKKALKVSQKKKSELVVHNKNGQIAKKSSHYDYTTKKIKEKKTATKKANRTKARNKKAAEIAAKKASKRKPIKKATTKKSAKKKK